MSVIILLIILDSLSNKSITITHKSFNTNPQRILNEHANNNQLFRFDFCRELVFLKPAKYDALRLDLSISFSC